MASMVKEKRPKKLKNKEKPSARTIVPVNEPSTISVDQDERIITEVKTDSVSLEVPEQNLTGTTSDVKVESRSPEPEKTNPCIEQHTTSKEDVIGHQTEAAAPAELTHCKELETNSSKHELIEIDSYKNLNLQLQRMAIPEQPAEISEARLLEIENIDAYLQANIKKLHEASRTAEMLEASRSAESALEMVEPSAPMIEDTSQLEIQEPVYSALPKVECMPLDEAIRLYGGTEMAAVRHMSEREEAEVEAGPNCGPEHPLVDLLSTFRSSLRALERERSKLANNFKDEEKYRNTLWKIEKRKIHLAEDCKCGLKVDMKATYEHAHLLKEKLPVAKLKLEGLLRDIQESYCHHQHAALLAYYLIEDLISETIKSNKTEIRTALSLILQALRVCDGAPEVLPASLQRWAETLAAALVDERDLRQLLFIMHHLFRQTRSVRWAARVLNTRVTDSITAARTLAVLDTLLSKLHLEAAVECIEETEEAWEEVDVKGGGGAVSSGTLRERDLIALLQALPLQQLIARLVLFSQADFRQATDEDWGDASGGNGLLKSCCGVRTLLSILQRAVTTHPLYERLHGMLRGVACSALTALACLYHTPRAPYLRELEGKIIAELEAAFAAGFTLFGTHELHKLPTTLLTEDSAKDYCLTFIVGLHNKSPKLIESLSIEAPVLPCDVRIRIATHAAIHREQDHELARIVLDFLLQTGLKRKSSGCKAGCEPASRECVPLLLATHPYLRGLALHTIADLSQVETLDASVVNVLQVDKWRPDVEEMQAVLDDWSKRCPTLLQQLLLQLDYTPYIGLSLEVQMRIGRWLCVWQAATPTAAECAWRVLRRLRTHRVCWPDAGEAPPPYPHPTDTFSMAFAVLACDWGASIPKICSEGIKAICKICATRPREAVHCLAPVMLTLTLSPESVSSTPEFAELFTQLINCGPNLVQRAFGRGGVSGSELLLRLVLKQVDVKTRIGGVIHVFPAWMHALWKVPSALGILDLASIAAKDWYALDVFATDITRNEQKNREYILNAVNYAATSPLLSQTILKKLHLNHVTRLPALYLALHDQRVKSQRIHVDNALVVSHANIPSEELVIYKCANAALVAPLNHPSHITLWRLFFHIYMERPPEMSNHAPPCGPLFFSGIIKSRLLGQIKRRLQETATYHNNEAQKYKSESSEKRPEPELRRSQSITKDGSFLPALTKKDLPGHESDSESDSQAESSSVVRDGTDEAIEAEKRRVSNMAAFHRGANRLMREYLRYLEEGDNLREGSVHADHARFITAEGFAEAWEDTLLRLRPPPSLELDDFIRPEAPPPKHDQLPKTPRSVAVASIQSVKCRPYKRSSRANRGRVDNLNNADYGNIRLILPKVEQLLKEIEKYAQEWRTEVCRIESLDSRLWELVTALRVPRPLPPVKKQCSNKCKSITFNLNTHEWCISEGAERGIKESRSASLAGIRRLSRARPQVAVSAAALQTIARRIRSAEHAVKVLELAWASARVCLPCDNAHAAIIALFQQLAERWITGDGELCRQLVQKGCASNCSTLQRTLCGTLVAPRSTPSHAWTDIYNIVLHSQLPSHTIFSYLSRFEMNRWRDIADEDQRTVILLSLHLSAQLYTKPEDSILLELVGVHTRTMMKPHDLCSILLHYTSISTTGVLPPAFWTHLNKAAGALAGELLFDDLGNILRSLGSAWFKVERGNSERTEMYSTYIADLLCILLRAFVAAAVKLTYEPARVGWYAWSAVAESWGPWVLPAGLLPPPPDDHAYIPMLERLTTCVREIMLQCPGSEPRMLTHIYSWVISTYRSVMRIEPNPPRLQMSALLEEMRELPWTEHQWFTAPSVAPTLDVIQHDEEELILWCCDQFRATKAATFLYDVDKTNTDLPGFLIRLLKLFTGNLYVSNPGLLKEACSLPWWHLSEDCLIEGLNEFFRAHYDLAQPYHDKPQAIVVLAASELGRQPQYSAGRVRKRQHALSRWTSASAAPALQAHRAPYTHYMLEQLTQIEPYLEKPEEARDLLYRLAHLMLWEQTESPNSVPMVWQQWAAAAPASLVAACVSVASQLTVLRHSAPIADAALTVHLHKCEGGWSEVCQLFCGCVFSARLYAESGALLAAYARALTASVEEVRPVLAALQAITEGNYDFVKNEAIIAVWICFATRVAWECDNITTVATEATTIKSSAAESAMKSATAQSAMKSSTAHVQFTADTKGGDIREECKHTAVSLLTAWGQQQRRSLIKVVTLQADTERPTARHRLLVRLAECILSPSPSTAQAYESACASVAACSGDVTTWGRCPSLRKLLRLAIRLFSTHERYFQWEMDQAPRE